MDSQQDLEDQDLVLEVYLLVAYLSVTLIINKAIVLVCHLVWVG